MRSRTRAASREGKGPVQTYGNAHRFRPALLAMARRDFTLDPSISTDERIKRFCFYRFLGRLQAYDPNRWLLKGGVAMAARYVHTRYTKDVDLGDVGDSLEDSFECMRSACDIDLRDFLEFEVEETSRDPKYSIYNMTSPKRGTKLTVTVRLAGETLSSFHVDLSVGAVTTTHPEQIVPMDPIRVPGVAPIRYNAMPIADVLADKMRATFELRKDGSTSARFRDLVDLVVTLQQSYVARSQLDAAIRANFQRHGIELPLSFGVPDPPRWKDGYGRLKEQYNMRDLPDFDAACELVDEAYRGAVFPVGVTLATTWNPKLQAWQSNCATRSQLLLGEVPHVTTPRSSPLAAERM